MNMCPYHGDDYKPELCVCCSLAAKRAATLRTKTLQAFVEDDGQTICIVEDHAQTDQEENEYVWIDMNDAAALRDWLTKVIGSKSCCSWPECKCPGQSTWTGEEP